MTKTLIYIYGSGVEIDTEQLKERLIDCYCLNDITEEGDERNTFNCEGVSELVFSDNLDYIKIDAELEIFKSLLFEFSELLSLASPKHIYSLGFSGDPNDYKPLPIFNSEEECLTLIGNDESIS